MPWHVVMNHSECPASKPHAVVADSDGSVSGCHASRADAEKQMAALYASERKATEMPQGREILQRHDAAVVSDEVDFKQRIIDVVAVPWDQEAEIAWRGEVWREVFERGAFNGIEDHAGRVPVNREHHRGDTIGKVVKLDPVDERGLLASIKIGKTQRGDETLQLASEEMLGASVGYFVKKPSDVTLIRSSMLRRVKRAFLDHLAMVEAPAYAGAMPVSVREGPESEVAREPLRTPSLDVWQNDDVLKWAAGRVGRSEA